MREIERTPAVSTGRQLPIHGNDMRDACGPQLRKEPGATGVSLARV